MNYRIEFNFSNNKVFFEMASDNIYGQIEEMLNTKAQYILIPGVLLNNTEKINLAINKDNINYITYKEI